MSDDLHDLYQEIILDHNKRPRHYGVLADATHQAEGYNPLCGDKVEVYLRVENARIAAIQFEAASCAICKASASMMVHTLKGQTLDQSESIQQTVAGILQGDADAPGLDTLGELAALVGVRKFPARVKCASLPWHTYQAALRGERKAETESPIF